MTSDGSVMAVEVNTSAGNSEFHAGVPKRLFTLPNPPRGPNVFFWDVTSDGKKFLFPVLAANTSAPKTAAVPFKVVLNWTATLKR